MNYAWIHPNTIEKKTKLLTYKSFNIQYVNDCFSSHCIFLHGEHHDHRKFYPPNQQGYIVLSNRWWQVFVKFEQANISLYLVHYALVIDKMLTNTNIKTYPCLCFVYTYYYMHVNAGDFYMTCTFLIHMLIFLN